MVNIGNFLGSNILVGRELSFKLNMPVHIESELVEFCVHSGEGATIQVLDARFGFYEQVAQRAY